MPLAFVDACARGRLPFDESSPAFFLAAIAVFLVVAVLALAGLAVQRARERTGA